MIYKRFLLQKGFGLIILVLLAFIAVGEASAAQIEIRARVTRPDAGSQDDHMALKINNNRVQSWYLRTNWQVVTHNTAGQVNINDVAVAFINDWYAGPGQDRNLYVDWVAINGVRYQTSESATATGCQWNNPNNEILACPGEFQYSGSGSSGARAVTIGNCSCQISDPGTLTEDDSFTVSAVNCSGFPDLSAVSYYWDKDKDDGRQADAGHTDDGDGNVNNDSGTMTYAGLSGSNQVSKTLSLYATDGSNSAYAERGVTINVKDPVKGTVYKDHDKDNDCNDSLVSFPGVDIRVDGTNNTTTNGSGNYTTSEFLRGTQHGISAHKTNYLVVDTGDFNSSPTSEYPGTSGVNFCLREQLPKWLQVQDGDAFFGVDTTLDIPATQQFMLGSDPPNSEGVLLSNNLVNKPAGSGDYQQGRSSPWKIDNYTPPLEIPTYQTFREIYGTRINETGNNVEEITPPTGTLEAKNGVHAGKVFFVDGNLTFGDPNFNGESVFFVSGDVTVTADAKQIKAAIIYGGKMTIEDSPTNKDLTIDGIVAGLGSGGIQINRNMTDNNDPAVKINYNSKYLIDFTDELGRSRIKWQEVAP